MPQITMRVELKSITPDAERLIEMAARTCYDSPVSEDTESMRRFIREKVRLGHESVVEHASATFVVTGVSRALTHQLVRHRVGTSFSQQSQRYVDGGFFYYVVPDQIADNPDAMKVFMRVMETIGAGYSELRGMGIKKEDARFLLPNAASSTIVFTANFRSLRNFLKLRLDRHAQWEIRAMAERMLYLLYMAAPSVFEDIFDENRISVDKSSQSAKDTNQ